MNKREEALLQLIGAYESLAEAGATEDFMQYASAVCSKETSVYFGNYGSDGGCFIEVRREKEEIVLRIGYRRNKLSIWKRIKEFFCEIRNIFSSRDTVYEIHLDNDNNKRFKDMLRCLEARNAAENVSHD